MARPRLHWSTDGRRLTYQQVDRGHQRFRVIEVDSQTGKTRNIIDEKTDTFIWTAHTENLGLNLVNWLEKTDEIIYVSERDGWRHLYLSIEAQARDRRTDHQGRVRRPRHRPHRRGEAADLVPRQRQEPGPGPVFHPLLPRQLRRHRPGRADRGQRHSHHRSLAGPQVPHRHLLARRSAAGPRAAPRVGRQARRASSKKRTSPN